MFHIPDIKRPRHKCKNWSFTYKKSPSMNLQSIFYKSRDLRPQQCSSVCLQHATLKIACKVVIFNVTKIQKFLNPMRMTISYSKRPEMRCESIRLPTISTFVLSTFPLDINYTPCSLSTQSLNDFSVSCTRF